MTSPLVLQVLELNSLLEKYGPLVRYPIQWNSEKCLYSPEKSYTRNLAWFCTSVVPIGILVVLMMFLILEGLHAPHLDKIANWINTIEWLPFATYIFLQNCMTYMTGPVDICNYLNDLISMSFSEYDTQGNLRKTVRLRTVPQRKYGMHLVLLLGKGKL